MRNLNTKTHCTALLLLILVPYAHARVYVEVANRLEGGRRVNVHCGSKEDDLGYHVLETGGATQWSFNVNFWGTTLFYCDVQWGDSVWYHFDAYDADRDNRRCKTLCLWMICDKGSLYGYDEESGFWERYPLISSTAVR